MLAGCVLSRTRPIRRKPACSEFKILRESPGSSRLTVARARWLSPLRTAVFASLHPFDGLQEVRADTAVVLELLATIMDADPGARTDMFVIGTLVGILKTPQRLTS